MRVNKCLVCGSSNLRADRALSGRLICASCGNPYGVKRVSSVNRYLFNKPTISKRNLVVMVFILSFLIIIFV